jgi:hypothetical protein
VETLSDPAAPADIDQVLAALAGIVGAARERRSTLGYFPALYQEVTRRVKVGIAQGFFDDGERMARLDVVFASRYLAAYQEYGSGGAASACWQAAFQETANGQLIILQALLLGINAHINFDLAIAAATVCPGEAIAGLAGDFDKINQILGSLLPEVEVVVGRFSPLIGLLDQIGGRSEEEVLGFSLDAARQDSWNHALVLAHLPPAVWPPALAAIDAKVTFLARLVGEPGGLAGKAVEMIRLTESIDVVAIIDALGAIDGGAASALPA